MPRVKTLGVFFGLLLRQLLPPDRAQETGVQPHRVLTDGFRAEEAFIDSTCATN